MPTMRALLGAGIRAHSAAPANCSEFVVTPTSGFPKKSEAPGQSLPAKAGPRNSPSTKEHPKRLSKSFWSDDWRERRLLGIGQSSINDRKEAKAEIISAASRYDQ
jgi:hypothetical protein